MILALSNVLSGLGKVVPILNSSFVQTEVNNVVYRSENIKNLQNSFLMLQRLVEDAERKQVKSATVQNWLERLKEVSYEADDLLDEWNTEKQKSEMQSVAEKVCEFPYSVSNSVVQFFLRDDIAHRVVEIQKKLDQIAKDKNQYELRHIEIETSVERRKQTISSVETKEIFGREVDKQTIVNKLVSEGSSQVSGVPVICIAGTAGFGKTTLSQLVFNADAVKKKFKENRMWVCVSQPFDEEKVLKEIIVEAGKRVPNTDGRNRLHGCLSDAIEGKLFLLVLDDVWEYRDMFWSQLKLALNGGSPGSRVLVTTRNEGVGKKMGDTTPHILKGLSNDDCWELFKHRSLQGRENPERFHETGRKLSDRCKGVPLAARVLSSLMLLKASEQDWQNVLDSSIWEITEDENGDGFLPELLFSYYALPPVLKQCFVYCAIFPEDMLIQKDKVVKLWMAEGLMGYNGMDNLEGKGEVYFDELAMRSFFQDTQRDAEGNIVSCKMHDLVREFALFLLNGPETKEVFPPWRYTYKEKIGEYSTGELVNFRAMIEPQEFLVSSETFEEGLVSLRALELTILSIPNARLPDEVGMLLHLRYLCLTKADRIITYLPETICDLLNLQTLGLNGCRSLKSLPGRIGELSNLRHLEVEETDALISLPEGIGKLSHLRTLCKFIVGAEGNGSKIEGLEHLRHLQGSLEITGLGNIVDENEVSKAKLKEKEKLRTLKLQFDRSSNQDEDGYPKKMETVLRDMEPPAGLKGLVISRYPGSIFPFWISSLSKLISLELKEFHECVDLPCLGKLPSLKKLSLKSSKSVQRLGMDFYEVDRECDNKDIFPRLEKLRFQDMPNLIGWEFPCLKNRSIMPRLSVLSIISCPKLNQLPFQAHEDVFPDLKELRIEGCSSQLLAGAEKIKSLIELRISEISLESEHTEERWSLPFGNNVDVFNNLSEVHIKSCKSLSALPVLGGLKNLVTLEIRDLPRVTDVGLDFLGMSNPNGPRSTSFPNLKNLEFSDMPAWERWEVPFQNKDAEFFPKLQKLEIKKCNKLLALPALGKLKSLERLTLERLNSVEHLGREFLGIWSDDNMVEDAGSITVFPKLNYLRISEMAKCKGEEGMMKTDQVGPIKVMPCLQHLRLEYCYKLVVVPSYMFSDSLRSLSVIGCPKLEGPQPYLPSSLVSLMLIGDLGVFSTSLPVNNNSCCKVRHVDLSLSNRNVLPGGFNQFTAIEDLTISSCRSLDFRPEDFTHLNTLKTLKISQCPRLSKSCRRGENWSPTSRPPTIMIDGDEIHLVYGEGAQQ